MCNQVCRVICIRYQVGISICSLLQLDDKFLKGLLSNTWQPKSRYLEDQASARRREAEEKASQKVEEFYKSREVPEEKESKKSKKPPAKTKKDAAPEEPSGARVEEERTQMEAEDQLARSLIDHEKHLEKRFKPYSRGIENENGIPLDCSGTP